MRYRGWFIRETHPWDDNSPEFLRFVARRQPTRKDGRLPMMWLSAALARYQGQRVSCVMKSWFRGRKHTTINGIYENVYKSTAPLGFSLELRDVVFDGDRLFGRRGGSTRDLARRRRKNHRIQIPISEIVETPDTPFWKALYKQLVAARVGGRRKKAGN